MRTRTAAVTILAFVLGACASTTAQKPVPSEGVVLASSMCAKRGQAAMSKDVPGERMVCGMEELVGSHLPKCVCRDEMTSELDRQTAQQYIRDAEHRQLLKGN